MQSQQRVLSLTSQVNHANQETLWSRGVKWAQSTVSILPWTFLLYSSNCLEFTFIAELQNPITILDLQHRVTILLCSLGSLPIQSKQPAVSNKNGKITIHFRWKRWPQLRQRFSKLDPCGDTCFGDKVDLNCDCVSTSLLDSRDGK